MTSSLGKGGGTFERIKLLLCDDLLPPIEEAIAADQSEVPRSNYYTKAYLAPLRCLISAQLVVPERLIHIGLLPHALERAPMLPTLGTVIAGMVLFFGLEKLVLWRHCHDPACDIHKAAGPLILLGDALHNFVDGVVIAAAFLAAVPLGIATAIAVIAHEVPQEVGDFAILLESGYTRPRALVLNALSSLATLLGALLRWLALDIIQGTIPAILVLSAASFLYIATADLIPHLHQRLGLASSLIQGLGLLAGIGTILVVRLFH